MPTEDDFADEADCAITATLTRAENAPYILAAPSSATVAVRDNDPDQPFHLGLPRATIAAAGGADADGPLGGRPDMVREGEAQYVLFSIALDASGRTGSTMVNIDIEQAGDAAPHAAASRTARQLPSLPGTSSVNTSMQRSTSA